MNVRHILVSWKLPSPAPELQKSMVGLLIIVYFSVSENVIGLVLVQVVVEQRLIYFVS